MNAAASVLHRLAARSLSLALATGADLRRLLDVLLATEPRRGAAAALAGALAVLWWLGRVARAADPSAAATRDAAYAAHSKARTAALRDELQGRVEAFASWRDEAFTPFASMAAQMDLAALASFIKSTPTLECVWGGRRVGGGSFLSRLLLGVARARPTISGSPHNAFDVRLFCFLSIFCQFSAGCCFSFRFPVQCGSFKALTFGLLDFLLLSLAPGSARSARRRCCSRSGRRPRS